MFTRTPNTRAPIALVVMASASLLFVNFAAAQDAVRKPQRSAVTEIGSEEDGTLVKIRYHDLNLKTDVGIRALYHRIKVAANRVCDQSLPVWATPSNGGLQKCVDTAVSAAVAQIGNTQLATVHQGDANPKNGG
jgi:UrcA family protein